MNKNYRKVDCPKCKPIEQIEEIFNIFSPTKMKFKEDGVCDKCNGKGYIIRKVDTIKL